MAKSCRFSIQAMPFYRSGPVPSAVAAVAVDHQRIASATRIRDIDEALIRRMFGALESYPLVNIHKTMERSTFFNG